MFVHVGTYYPMNLEKFNLPVSGQHDIYSIKSYIITFLKLTTLSFELARTYR